MTLFKALSTVALALVLFVPAKTASSGDFPAGVSFSHIVGAVLEPHRANKLWTTIDAVDFGFMTRYVRICLRPQAANLTAYFRMNTTVAGAVLLTNLLAYPVTTAALFIDGTSGASFDFGALPMSSPATTGGQELAKSPRCITEPWRTRGIIMHVAASGLATADVWGYR